MSDDNALILTTIAVDVSTGVAQLKKFETTVENLATKVDAAVKKMDSMGGKVAPKIKQDTEEVKGLSLVLDRLGLTWGRLAAYASSYIVAVSGFSAIKGFFSSVVHEALQGEVALNKLELALKAQGREVEATVPHLKAYAEELARLSTASDTTIIGLQKVLISIGGLSGDSLDKATKATLDLAQGMNVGVEQAARIMARAAEGMVGPLRRYGLQINAGLSETEKFGKVLEFVQQKFGGFAQGELNTVSGRLERLTNDWDSLKQAMGTALLSMTDVSFGLTTLSKGIQAVTDELKPEGIGLFRSLILIELEALNVSGSFKTLTEHAEALRQASTDLSGSLGGLNGMSSESQKYLESLAKRQAEWADKLSGAATKARQAGGEVDYLNAALSQQKSADAFAPTLAKLDLVFEKAQRAKLELEAAKLAAAVPAPKAPEPEDTVLGLAHGIASHTGTAPSQLGSQAFETSQQKITKAVLGIETPKPNMVGAKDLNVNLLGVDAAVSDINKLREAYKAAKEEASAAMNALSEPDKAKFLQALSGREDAFENKVKVMKKYQSAIAEAAAELDRLGVKAIRLASGEIAFTPKVSEEKTVDTQRFAPREPGRPLQDIPLKAPEGGELSNVLKGYGPEQAKLLQQRLTLLDSTSKVDLSNADASIGKFNATLKGTLSPEEITAAAAAIRAYTAAGREAQLTAAVAVTQPGSEAQFTAQQNLSKYSGSQKVEALQAQGLPDVAAQVAAANRATELAAITFHNQAKLDKEKDLQQRLLELKTSGAVPGSADFYKKELAAFDNKAKLELERATRLEEDTTTLKAIQATERANKNAASLDQMDAASYAATDRLVASENALHDQGLTQQLDDALKMFDTRAAREMAKAEEVGLFIVETEKALANERLAIEEKYLDQKAKLDLGNALKMNTLKQASGELGATGKAEAKREAFRIRFEIERLDVPEEEVDAFMERMGQEWTNLNNDIKEEWASTWVDMMSQAQQALESIQGSHDVAMQNIGGGLAVMGTAVAKGYQASIGWATKDKNAKIASVGAMTQAVGASVQASFGKTKAGQYAATVVNTAGAMMSAISELGPIAGPIMAALIGAMGMVQLAKIKSTTLEGGGGVSAASLPAYSASMAGGGPGGVTGTQALLVGQDSSATATTATKPAVIVNVALHALDEKDVRTYLTSPEIRKHVAEAYDLQKTRG